MAQSGGIGERFGFDRAAARPDGFQIAKSGSFGPDSLSFGNQIIKAVMGIRVSEEEEYEGLDVGECGVEAYPEFVNN